MEDGNRLLAAGNAAQAAREVPRGHPPQARLGGGPGRAGARRGAGEDGAGGRGARREVETRLAAARQAAENGEFDRALDELSAVLLLQPENADALSIRDP